MIISASNLGMDISEHHIFSDISLTVPECQMTALIGPSGSGKTTLLNVLGLIQRPTMGAVMVGDDDATHWSDAKRRHFWRDHAAFVYQDYGIIDEENIAYNVTLARSKPDAAVDEILKVVGLSGRAKDPASVLSGGEKQRLGVARSIYKKAGVIFADEPTASLDTDNQSRIIALLRARAEAGASVVISTHDLALAAVCDQIIELSPAQGSRQPEFSN